MNKVSEGKGNKMIRTYKRKLVLNKTQEVRLRAWIGACRVVYNLGMEIKLATYKATGKNISNYTLQKQLKGVRAEVKWINDVPAQALICVLDRLDNSFKSFFRTFSRGGGFPRYANKKRYKSIQFKQVKVNNGRVILPKIGELKIISDSKISGIPKTASIIQEPTGFFVCIQCKDVPIKFESENQAIGLDMGLSQFCVDSNGGFVANPRHFKKHERQLRIENRSLARKKKGSNSWIKQAKKLSRLHHRIVNVRKDFLHKESTKIAKVNSLVVIEDLNISGMSKNKKLSKHILDAGWGTFKTMLEYKTTVLKVDARHTSQMCFECGSIDSKSRISQSEFCCTSCGHLSNADVNAAKNILSRGMALVR